MSIVRIIKECDEYYEEENKQVLDQALNTWETQNEVDSRFKVGSFGHHESIDRIHIIQENLESYVLNHHSVVRNMSAFKMCFLAQQLLLEAYQILACENVEDTSY